MAAVGAGLSIFGSVVPRAGFVGVCAVVPFGVVTNRHRVRVLIASAIGAASITALVAGLGSAFGTIFCAFFGGWVGQLRRRERGVPAVALSAAVLGPLFGGLAVLALTVFAAYRRLVLASARSTFRGLDRTLAHVGPLHAGAHAVQRASAAILGHWQISVAVAVAAAVISLLAISWVLIGRVLERLAWITDSSLAIPGTVSTEDAWAAHDRHDRSRAPGGRAPDAGAPDPPADATAAPAPVPVRLSGVGVRHGEIVALEALDLEIDAGQFIVVVGDNGSGKSTLARVLAGAEPTSGAVTRAGAVGLGQPGGTALITQRPDAQVVGLRVADDVVWGLSADHGVDVEELLVSVGLGGMGGHDTATLSGGQLQRLAIAAALARHPQLLISDESTAMIDPAGRREIVQILAGLPRSRSMTVLHITHNVDELASADRVIRLDRGRLLDTAAPTAAPAPARAPRAELPRAELPRAEPPRAEPAAPDPARPQPLLELRDVSHDYAHGTVWEHHALIDLTLSVNAGDGVLIVGDNGSGKSTLAWIIAGLLRPTHGECRVDGRPSHRNRVAAAIAFQHARLQLQRPTVAEDVADAAGWLRDLATGAERRAALAGDLKQRVDAVLTSAGLDPALGSRSIEQLSGGQQRRVAFAGLMARNPRLLVLDEPLAGLDMPTRASLVALLTRLRREQAITLIVVTHDPDPLREACPRTIGLRGGRLVADSDDAAAGDLSLIGSGA